MSPDWHRSAVFYELLVRSFQDSDGDGVGDLPGLLQRMDHLDDLGVDCLWLLPVFPSPLRDGGYDVTDLRGVHEQLGTLAELRAVLDEAHDRGMRVVMDLLLNHTSDQHPWFQASRSDPAGPYGDFYVWADHDQGYPGVPVVFCDTEPSNWTYDEVRGQWYWHRFFHHQPDLNLDNPRVRDELLATMRFWLELGVDGFRLDAVPYLFAREGTSCAHLPETHAFLKQARALVDAYPGRVLLAEANGSADEVAGYFGDGDECHLAMHFPLMPRMFLALAQGSAQPVRDALAAAHEPPPGCSWATFLRNHDELSLEAVSDEERSALYEAYAPEPRMRANVGIRRRLASLAGGPAQHVLLTRLLLSVPGTPILYYGDEIGMGDDIRLPDRDAVRTPMQWEPAASAGFSSADPADFHLPLVTGGLGPQQVSVAAQRGRPRSVLGQTRSALHARRRHPALSQGRYVELPSPDPAVLAFLRHHEHDTVLCVASFSAVPQSVHVPLEEHGPVLVVDLLGETAGEVVLDGQGDAIVPLEGYGMRWFTLLPVPTQLPADQPTPTVVA